MIKKELVFTFFSDGTPHAFAPHKEINDPFTKKRRYQVELMLDEVKHRNSPTVFILDNKGYPYKG